MNEIESRWIAFLLNSFLKSQGMCNIREKMYLLISGDYWARGYFAINSFFSAAVKRSIE